MSNSGSISFTSYQDIQEGLLSWRRWILLGWYDFSLRYRRTAIGPLWQALQLAIWVGGLAIVFHDRFGEKSEIYIPYLASGMALWNYMASSLTDGCHVFSRNRSIINNINTPITLHVYRFLTTAVIRMAYQFLVFLCIIPFFPVPFGWQTLWVIPGLLVMIFTSVWVVLLMGIIGTRFRDTSFAIASVMRFMFFITPIFWFAESMGDRALIATLNPFAHFMDIVRSPILGTEPSMMSWLVVLGITFTGFVVTLFSFHKVRPAIVFWL